MSSGLHVKYPLFFADFNETRTSSTFFRKNTKVSNFMKIRPAEAELLYEDRRTDGWTDMTKLIVAFSQFCESTYKEWVQSGLTQRKSIVRLCVHLIYEIQWPQKVGRWTKSKRIVLISLDVHTWIPVPRATALSVSLRVGHGPLHTPVTMTLEHSPTFPTRELNSGTHKKLK